MICSVLCRRETSRQAATYRRAYARRHHSLAEHTQAPMETEGPYKCPKRRARTAGASVSNRGPGFQLRASQNNRPRRNDPGVGPRRVKMEKSNVRFGNKEGGRIHFGLEERFAWQKALYVSDAMYTMPTVKAPPFSFGTSTRADWKKMMENTKDLHNPNGRHSVWKLLC